MADALGGAASAAPRPLDAERRALSAYQARRRVVVALAAAALAVVLALTGSIWDDRPVIRAALGGAGVLAVASGVLGRVWSGLFIGGRKTREVVRAGPYAVVRHPLYLFSAVAAGGYGLFHGSLALGGGLFFAALAGFRVVAAREERALAAGFGAEHEAYRRAVRPFWPTRAGAPGPARLIVRRRAAWRTVRDSAWYFAPLPLMLLAEALRRDGVLPVLAHLP
jgi:protein-S-isoprenylcysteine O-methyltransferase Ste14